MPIPKPKSGEQEKDFISRCMHEIGNEYEQSQALAICYSNYQKENMSEEVFVLKPKKAENRGQYLKRCASNNRMRLQHPNMRERMNQCLNAFNSYYKYWAKLEDFGEIPKDSILADCIAQEKAKGKDYRTAYASCSTKVVAPSGTITLSDDDNLIEEPVLS